QRREDQREDRAEDAGDDRRPRVIRDAAPFPDRHEAERVEDRVERQPDADERGDVDEEGIRDADVPNESRRLANEQARASAGRQDRPPGRGLRRRVDYQPWATGTTSSNSSPRPASASTAPPASTERLPPTSRKPPISPTPFA